MTIDWSVRFGDVITVLGFFCGGLSVIFMMKSDVRALGMKLGFLKETVDKQSVEIGKFAELLTVMGRYEERFTALRNEFVAVKQEIVDLRHGRGFVDVEVTRRRPHDGG